MKFIRYIMLRVTISLVAVFGAWAILFFYITVDEINDETDDVLEDYSTTIIQNFLAGEVMPSNNDGSNNRYTLRAIAADSVDIVRGSEGFINEDIFIEYKNEYEPARILRQVFMDANHNHYLLTVITPTIDDEDLISAILHSLAILFILLLLVVVIINILTIKAALYPLYKFRDWLNCSDVETSELPKVETSNIQEIKDITRAIEVFAERSRKSFEQQKEFIGNASHELQTPIAICQNRMELLLNSGGLTEQQLCDITTCLTTLSRLSKLNQSLLMLSKIENGGFESQQVDIGELLHRDAEVLREINEHRNISLNITEQGSCIVEANRELVTTLIFNLLKNSYSHNVDGGRIEVVISPSSLTVANTPRGEALESEKIFDRFYQGSSRSGSYGLGLSIVQSICKLYGFSAEYTYSSGLHQFKINFK